jgi:hypothetical protein
VAKLLLAAWLLIAPTRALAADSEPPVEDVTVTAAPNPAAGERSDGRIDPPPKRGWRLVPEVLLFPLRGLFWLIGLPVGAALRTEDRVHPMRRVIDAISWSEGTRGIRPAFYYSTIYVPEFGLRYFDHRSLGVDTNLEVTATVGGANYVYSSLTVEPTRRSAPFGVVFDLIFDRRGDLLYNGLGSHTYSDAATGRYLMNALEPRLGLRLRPLPWLGLFATFSSGIKRFDNGDRVGGDSGIIYSYDTATIPGFVHGTTFLRAGSGIVVDLRNGGARAFSGVLVQASFDYTHGVDGDTWSYERLRGLVMVPINLWAHTHVLRLQAATTSTWQNDAAVPFSELATLGGPDDLRGFRFQDFRDYSSFYATAEYRWPLWMWVDGAIFVDYGGVFGQNYANFGARRMQPDVGVGMHIVTSGNFHFRAQLGYGFGEGVNFSLSGTGL